MNQELVEICLHVRDIEATLDFYTNLFDVEVASRREFPEDKLDLVYLTNKQDKKTTFMTTIINSAVIPIPIIITFFMGAWLI